MSEYHHSANQYATFDMCRLSFSQEQACELRFAALSGPFPLEGLLNKERILAINWALYSPILLLSISCTLFIKKRRFTLQIQLFAL